MTPRGTSWAAGTSWTHVWRWTGRVTTTEGELFLDLGREVQAAFADGLSLLGSSVFAVVAAAALSPDAKFAAWRHGKKVSFIGRGSRREAQFAVSAA